jgi:hypothetical protein
MRLFVVPLCLCGFILLLTGASPAQTSQAVLEGRITNQATGQPVARALVIERDLATNNSSYRYTNEYGLYYFSALPPGTYTIRVDALGFRPEERSPVELPVAAHIELNFDLTAGEIRVPAAPAAEAPPGTRAENILSVMYGSDAAVPQAVMTNLPLQATETLIGSISRLIDSNQILELPLAGRDVYTMLVLQPGVSSDNATVRGLGFSVNGQRSGSSNFLLDGVDNNDLILTGPSTFISADAVKEYRMTTSNYTAEFGRASGFVANAITRSGGNAFHGTLFEFFDHTRLNANSSSNNTFGLARQPFHQDQFGASLGGPIRRDRLFFFGNFEQDRTSSQSTPDTRFVPNQKLLALFPSSSPGVQLLTQFAPPAGTPLPGTASSSCAVNFAACFNEVTFTRPFLQRKTLALGRADYNSADGRGHLTARYSSSQDTRENYLFSIYPGLNAPLTSHAQNVGVSYTRDVYRGTNEVKFGYVRNFVQLLRPHPELPAIDSLDPYADPATGNIAALAYLSPTNVVLPGTENTQDYSARNSTFHIVENYSQLRGRHALSAGIESRIGLTSSLSTTKFSSGEYAFVYWTDFFFNRSPYELAIPMNRLTGTVPSQADFWRYYRQTEWAGFVQDNVKVTRRLTLNLGLRYEYFGVPIPRNGTVDSNFVFGGGPDIGQRIASGQLQNGSLYVADSKNIAPRFSFAFDPTGNGSNVIRGGFGIFFDRIFDNVWYNVRNNNLPVQAIVQTSLGGGISGLNADSATLYNLPSVFSSLRFTIPAGIGGGQLNPGSVQNTSTVALDPNMSTPYSESWFAGFQHELARNFIVEVNGTGSSAHKLVTADLINRPDSLARTLANPHGRFNTKFGDVVYYSPQGHSKYAALQTSIRSRATRSVQFQLSYTYAHTKDVQSDPLLIPIQTSLPSASGSVAASNLDFIPVFFRQFDPNADYGNSDFDQRHNLVLNFVAQTPSSPRWRRVLNGWQLSGLTGIRSGFPFNVFVFPDFIGGERGTWSRAQFIGTDFSQAFVKMRTPVQSGVQVLDPGQFRAPTGPLGNVPRNAFYGPGFWNADFSLARMFALKGNSEQRRLQLRLECFNCFNHTNLNNPDAFLGFVSRNGTITSPNQSFGQAGFGRQGFSSAVPSVSPLNEQPRRLQLAAKIYF